MERIKLAIDRARQQAGVAYSPDWTQPGPTVGQGIAVPPSLGVPVDLVPLDPVHLERHRVVTLEQDNPLRQPFDLLRTQVLQKMAENGWRTIAVTSPSMQSGKTMVAINLALSIAHHPARTALLVDFDLRRPDVASYLGLTQGDTLSEVLADKADLRSAIVHAGLPGFLVLPTRRKVPGASEVLASDRVTKILAALRDDHPERVIVIDLPPVTVVDDAIAVLPRVDCVLLVVGNGSSTKQQVDETRRHLARFNLIGVVVNKVAGPATSEGYY
jgi:capsular exopolysaccharide synthesis family protein